MSSVKEKREEARRFYISRYKKAMAILGPDAVIDYLLGWAADAMELEMYKGICDECADIGHPL